MKITTRKVRPSSEWQTVGTIACELGELMKLSERLSARMQPLIVALNDPHYEVGTTDIEAARRAIGHLEDAFAEIEAITGPEETTV